MLYKLIMSKAEVTQVLAKIQREEWFTNAEGLLRAVGKTDTARHIGGDCLYLAWQFAKRYREQFPDREAGLLTEIGRDDYSGHVTAAAKGKNGERWFCDPCYFMREPLSLSRALHGRPQRTRIADFTREHPLIIEGSKEFTDMIYETFTSPDYQFEKAFDTRLRPIHPEEVPFARSTATAQKSHLYIFGLFPKHPRDKWKIWIDLGSGEVSAYAKHHLVRELAGSLDTEAFMHVVCQLRGTTYEQVYQLLQDAREIHNGLHPLPTDEP